MRAGRMMMLGAAAALLSGCAAMQSRTDLSRFESQLGLLEERVSQLERSSVAGAGVSSDPLAFPPADSGMAFEEPRPRPSKRAATASSPAPSSLKPSTKEVQQALKNAGFYQGSVDGRSGPMTRDAVKEFQRVHGLQDDGVVGKQTWAKLKAYSTLSGDSGEAIAGEPLK
jgi:peptidoglycan hydrolase-like protein with peptidoglycan-binding domain